MIKRDRSKQVLVQSAHFQSFLFSGVLQVGDVFGDCYPFSYSEAYGGYRGAPSFATQEVATPQSTRLHFANQVDEDMNDITVTGEQVQTFIPNIRGGKARR